MNTATVEATTMSVTDQVPAELVALKERISGQAAPVRAELEPLIDEAMEHALFRSRVMWIARDALQQFRLDLASLRFDRDMMRRSAPGV